MGMGEKSKGQWECAVNRINPQTTPQIPTLLKNEKLPNEPISDFGLHSAHQHLMPICILTNPENEPIFKQALDFVTFVCFCSNPLPRPRRPGLSRRSPTEAEAPAKADPSSAFTSVFQPNQTESRERAELTNVKFKVSPSESK